MFSVIIPLYNKGKYLADTLKSVFDQTYQKFEIVIVNDGSTDNSLSIAESFTDPRVKIFSKVNGGASSARNYGVDKASYEYMAFLDADDHWEPTYLETMKDLIDKYPGCGMYASAHRVVHEKKTVVHCSNFPEGIVDNYFEIMINHPLTWTSATIVTKKAMEDVKGFPVGMVAGQDCYAWAKVAAKYKVAFTPKVLASYNYINNGMYLREGKVDTSTETWYDLFKEGDFYRNEYIARKGIIAGRRYAVGNHKKASRDIENKFNYTKLSRRQLIILSVLNRLPKRGIKLYKYVFNFYTHLLHTI